MIQNSNHPGRDWYQIQLYRLDKEAHCPDCGLQLAGRFDEEAGDFGARRIPVAIKENTND